MYICIYMYVICNVNYLSPVPYKRAHEEHYASVLPHLPFFLNLIIVDTWNNEK